MRRFVCAVLLLLACYAPSLQGAERESVQPFRWDEHEVCTTFSIHEQQGYWITARHCLTKVQSVEDKYTMNIKGFTATLELESEQYDAVVMKSAYHAKALPLASEAPIPDDKVRIHGYPDGYRKFSGKFLGLWQYGMDPTIWNLYSAKVEKGTSGGPVLTDHGVIGILNFSVMTEDGKVRSGGTAWGALHELLVLGYWDAGA